MSVDATVCADAEAFGGMPVGRRYWLRRCEGFRVEGPDGRLGFVEEARLDGRADEPVALVVHGSAPGRVVVPVSEVAEVLPLEERILLRSTSIVGD